MDECRTVAASLEWRLARNENETIENVLQGGGQWCRVGTVLEGAPLGALSVRLVLAVQLRRLGVVDACGKLAVRPCHNRPQTPPQVPVFRPADVSAVMSSASHPPCAILIAFTSILLYSGFAIMRKTCLI